VPIDVTVRSQVDDLVHQAIASFGRVQFQFNCTGAAIRQAKYQKIDDALLRDLCSERRQHAGGVATHAGERLRRGSGGLPVPCGYTLKDIGLGIAMGRGVK
jgi:hypothetical protein